MKYIMLPIHSNWVCSIMNGIKKIEVRSGTRLYNAINKLIDEQGKAPCLAYCTKGKIGLYDNRNHITGAVDEIFLDKLGYDKPPLLNGKVVAMFEASAEEIYCDKINGSTFYSTKTLSNLKLQLHSCVGEKEMDKYFKGNNGTAIHIHNLKIFDKPKELREFFVRDKKGDIPVQVEELKGSKFMALKRIEHAPQSYCFCEVNE